MHKGMPVELLELCMEFLEANLEGESVTGRKIWKRKRGIDVEVPCWNVWTMMIPVRSVKTCSNKSKECRFRLL